MSTTIEIINTIPFVDLYLEEYGEDEYIKNILNNYDHKILDSTSLELFSLKKIREEKYDTILFYNKNDYYDEIENNLFKFKKIKEENNILLILKYTTCIHQIETRQHVIYNVNIAVIIDINTIETNDYNKIKNIPFTNRLMILNLIKFSSGYNNHNKHLAQYNYICSKKVNIITKYLPSSIKIMDVNTNYCILKKMNNLPNKIIIFRIIDPVTHHNNKQKYPLKSLLIINNGSFHHKNGEENFVNNENMIKKLIFNKNDTIMLRTDFFDRMDDHDENNNITEYKRYHFSIIKNKKTIKFLISESQYKNAEKNLNYGTDHAKKNIFEIEINANNWFAISGSILEKQKLISTECKNIDSFCYRKKFIKSKILYEENICNLNDFIQKIENKIKYMITKSCFDKDHFLILESLDFMK